MMVNTKKPSALSRLKDAYKFYKRGHSRVITQQPSGTKKVPFLWPAWVNNQPQWQLINYEAYANEGFSANAVIYSAIMYKVRSITTAPLRAYEGTPEAPELLPPNHPLQALCMRPNKFQSWSEFQGLATVYFNLSGNSYTVLNREGGEITEMYHLRPDRVFIMPASNKRELIGYWYVPEGKSWQDGVPYMPQDVIHIKLPNPLDPLDGLGYGVSPLSPAAHNADVDNDLTKFFRVFFKAGAMPPGVLTYDVPMLDDDVSRARERWMEKYGGYENWKDVAVLDQGGKYERIGLTFDEMDVSAIDARNESRIVAPFGVPLNLIESRPELVQSTYSNKAEDRTMFWEDTMRPELKWFETDYQYYLQGDNDAAFVQFDLTQVPALTMTKSERLDKVQKGFDSGAVLIDELRAELGFDPLPEDVLAEMQQKPEPDEDIIEATPPEDDDMEGQPEAEEESEERDKGLKKKTFSRLEFWTKSDKLAQGFEAEFAEAATGAFAEDLIFIEATINDANRDALDHNASLNWEVVTGAVGVYFATAAAANWQRNFALPTYQLMSDRINALNKQFGHTTPTAEMLGKQWFNEYTIKFAQPINDLTEETVRRIIEQGVREGWSIPTTQKNIKTVFDQWMKGGLSADEFQWFADRLPAYRTEMIARTETIKSLNNVSTRLYEEWDIQEHEWLATMDKRVRPDHAAADGQVVKVGTPFKVGGESLLYPGDPAGSPGNVINCRCTTIPVINI